MRTTVLVLSWRLFRTGGIPLLTQQIVRDLDPQKFDVHLCLVRGTEPSGVGLANGVQIHSLGLPEPHRIVASPWVLLRMIRVVSRVRPDSYLAFSGYPVLSLVCTPWLGRSLRVLEVNDPPQSRRIGRLNAALEGVLIKRFGFTVLSHTETVATLVADWYGLTRQAVRTFPLGIDLEAEPSDEERLAARTALGVDPSRPVVVYVARLVASKRVDDFLDVAARVLAGAPGCLFLIAGDGSDRDRLERTRDRMGLDGAVRFLGRVPDVRVVLAAGDVFLSTSEFEGFGLGVVEAMAAGLPVVAVESGGLSDVLAAGGGLLRRADDKDGLAEATVELLLDRDARQTQAARGRRRAVQHYGAPAQAADYAKLLSESPAAGLFRGGRSGVSMLRGTQ